MVCNKLISEDIYEYILDNSNINKMHQSDIEKEMYLKAMADDHSILITPQDQISFLVLLIKIMGASKVIELGVFRGVTTLSMALTLPENGKVFACDISDKYLLDYKHYWDKAGISHKIDLSIKPAVNFLQELELNYLSEIDFIYIDANKWQYNIYYEYAYKLLRQGGVMILDNMLQKGKIADNDIQKRSFQAVRSMNEFIKKDSRVEAVLLSIGDGISIVRKV